MCLDSTSMFVLPVRKGGLGNQLFQVAAGLIYAKETERFVLLPQEFYNGHNPLKQEYADTIFSSIKYRVEKQMDETAIMRLVHSGEFHLYPGEPGFEDWLIHDTPGNIILHGYFQSYPAIGRHESYIRWAYLSGLPYCESRPYQLGIHIRRGDYLKPPFNEMHYNLTEGYYREAVEKIVSLNPEIVGFSIFSDDLDWCKQQEFFKSLPHVEFIDEIDEIKTLALMSKCQGGFICANSTFSWWGAFLGAYSLRKPCLVPKTWFKGGVGNLFPQEWIVL